MRLIRKTVSAPFRALVAELYPGLGANRAYWEFFGYLLFGSFFDRDTGRLVINQGLLAEIEGKPVNRYRGIEFLEAFRRDVLSPETFEWTQWAANKDGRGKCRQVKKFGVPPQIEEAVEAELLKTNHSAGRVYFVDGTAFSRAKQAADRKEYRRAATDKLENVDCDLAREILEYLNALPSNRFSKLVKKNLPDALAVAEGIKNPRGRKIQLRILRAIADQPQPFYSPSSKGRTVRIFGVHECFVSLKGEVRRALTRSCSEADLANSQLAICARLWNIPEIENFLASGKNFWIYLCERLGFTAKDKALLKDAFKEPLYSACFGMPKSHVQAAFTRNLNRKGIKNGGARLVLSPLMKALFEARGRMVEMIRAHGGGLNCFGKWISLNASVSVDSILAQQAQAVELKLLHPLIKLAREHPDDFSVLLWQHDGATIYFHRRADLWRQKIVEAVQGEIDESGIKTHLEWKHGQCDERMTPEREETPQHHYSSHNHLHPRIQGRKLNTHSNHWNGILSRENTENAFTKPSHHY